MHCYILHRSFSLVSFAEYCDAINDCSGKGTCKEDEPNVGTCECNPEYTGTDCSCSKANTCSGNGVCQAKGICKCKTGFVGDDCSSMVYIIFFFKLKMTFL